MEYTLKEVFSIVKKRAENQLRSAKSYFSHDTVINMCMYRAQNGLKCFIGELIPDEVYKPEMEKLPIKTLFYRFPEIEKLFPGIDIHVLKELQDIHDMRNPSTWMKEIESLETRVNNTYSKFQCPF